MEQIIGTGSMVPELIVSNQMLEGFMDTSDEWIRERTGICQRHVASKETVASLAIGAAKHAIENAGIDPLEIGLIIVATSTAENIYPCTACQVQAAIGATNAGCFDLNAACSGFLTAYQMACGQLAMGQIKAALVIGSEVLSHVTNGEDRGTAVLFGDGAGAVVVKEMNQECRGYWLTEAEMNPRCRRCWSRAAELAPDDAQFDFSFFTMGADGSKGDALVCESGIGNKVRNQRSTSLNEKVRSLAESAHTGQRDTPCAIEKLSPEVFLHTEAERTVPGTIRMDGRGIYQFAVKKVPETLKSLLAWSGRKADDIDYYILHQANRRIIESIARHLKQPMEKFPMILAEHGNMSSACIPVLLDTLNRQGKLERGMKLALAGFGAGLTWAGAILRW